MLQQQTVNPGSGQASQEAQRLNPHGAEEGLTNSEDMENPIIAAASDDSESYFSPGASLHGRPSQLSQVVVTTCTDL
jgi:hypothetical protein